MTGILWCPPKRPLTDHALESERRGVLARFLTEPEASEAAWAPKPEPERELFRTGHGECDGCSRIDLLHRFEIDPKHVALLYCRCDGADERYATTKQWICDRHLAGTHTGVGFGEAVECDRASDPWDADGAWCRIAWWLSSPGHMPWLCPRCWKQLVAEELAHLALPAGAAA